MWEPLTIYVLAMDVESKRMAREPLSCVPIASSQTCPSENDGTGLAPNAAEPFGRIAGQALLNVELPQNFWIFFWIGEKMCSKDGYSRAYASNKSNLIGELPLF